MAHFTVLVTNTDKKSVEEQLAEHPNKWDRYMIGGRWAGYFPLKKGAVGKRGENGVANSYKSLDGVDIVKIKDIDWKKGKKPLVTFAMLHNGEWVEREYIWFWDMHMPVKRWVEAQWQEKFNQFMNALAIIDPETEVTIVDCQRPTFEDER